MVLLLSLVKIIHVPFIPTDRTACALAQSSFDVAVEGGGIKDLAGSGCSVCISMLGGLY